MANGHGGPRPNSGRPTNEFREWLEDFKKTHPPERVLEMYWAVAAGEPMEQVVTDAGESISTPAAVRDRLKAGELYLDRTIGKVPQVTELSGPDGDPLPGIPASAVPGLIEALRQRTSSPPGTKA